MKKTFFSALMLLSCYTQSNAQEYYEKHLEFPPQATVEEKIDMASRLVPTPQQLEWQQMELTAFLHFGINTFTEREWGDGKEDPALFNPTGLDCEQWVRALKEGGFKMAVITAKHHDGFCLWPTKTTRHSVVSSPWKNGKGDVVRELRNACKKYGLKFGIYLSPWDRNAECYGQGDAYNRFFIEQLTELLTNYGEVHEVWFDGANGEGANGKKQIYDWEAIERTIRRLQPKAVTAVMGDDVRWVGNEKGIGRKTEWSATVLTPGIYSRAIGQNKELGVFGKSKDLGSRDIVARAKELFWFPSEVDVSIRPGWFYHSKEDSHVKSLAHLADIYFKSVGYNSVLLLNIPPNKSGLIHENDCRRLKEFFTYLKNTFEKDYPDLRGHDFISNISLLDYRLVFLDEVIANANEKNEHVRETVHDVTKSLLYEDQDIQEQLDSRITFGQKVADEVARFGGSWTFILSFVAFMAIWMGLNVVQPFGIAFDKYPFILLNLALSTLAAVSGTIDYDESEFEHRIMTVYKRVTTITSIPSLRKKFDFFMKKIDHLVQQDQSDLLTIQKLQTEMIMGVSQQVEKMSDDIRALKEERLERESHGNEKN